MAENADNMDMFDTTTKCSTSDTTICAVKKLNASNVTTLPEWLDTEILRSTYLELGLSTLVLLVSALNAIWLQCKVPRTFVFKVLQLDCMVTATCQSGYIAILLSSISEEPNVIICMVGTALSLITYYHFIWSGLSIAIAR